MSPWYRTKQHCGGRGANPLRRQASAPGGLLFLNGFCLAGKHLVCRKSHMKNLRATMKNATDAKDICCGLMTKVHCRQMFAVTRQPNVVRRNVCPLAVFLFSFPSSLHIPPPKSHMEKKFGRGRSCFFAVVFLGFLLLLLLFCLPDVRSG